MGKIKATENQWKKLDSFLESLRELAYQIEMSGQDITINTKPYYVLSEKELLRLSKGCNDIEEKIKKFLEKEVAPWV